LEESDKSDKTEKPTQHKIDEARKKGQIPVSKEVHTFTLFLVLTFIFMAIFPYTFKVIALQLRFFFEFPHTISFENMNGREVLWKLFKELSLYFFIMILPLAMGAIMSGGSQTGFNVSLEHLKPKFDKISPAKGLKRLFSSKSIGELIKGIIKILLVGFAIYWVMIPSFKLIGVMTDYSMMQTLDALQTLILKIILVSTAILFLIAASDYAYQRYQWYENLRMTKQEVKEEYRQQEGDPHVKAKQRDMRAQLGRARMASKVKDATVIITNPTHYAVALKYIHGEMEAPQVVAKGVDFSAEKIREIAIEYYIPIIQNPPLARSLYAEVEVDEFIPEAMYKVVAEIIRRVLKIS
jgi:flagellar biosynthetic protein FlhB